MVAQTQNRQQRQESNRSSMESVESVYKGGCSCVIISRDQFGSSNYLFFEIHRYLKHGGHDQHLLWWLFEFFYWIPGSLQCWAWLICRGRSSCHLVPSPTLHWPLLCFRFSLLAPCISCWWGSLALSWIPPCFGFTGKTKRLEVGKGSLGIVEFTADILAVDRIPSPAH